MKRAIVQAWRELGSEQGAAASVLREKRLHAPSVGRAYYAAYSVLTAELLAQGSSFARGRKNPDHEGLPLLVQSNLGSVDQSDRKKIAAALRRLRSRRENADYRPQFPVTDEMSREALIDFEQVKAAIKRKGVA